MRFIHAIGYAAASLFAAGIGASFTAVIGEDFRATRAAVFMIVCAIVGAYVGWNRTNSSK